MRKLIEIEHESLITCDTPNCNYKVPYPKMEKDLTNCVLKYYIDKPCPKCGANLLTREDYTNYTNMMKIVNWLNKYFSWITIFYSKNKLNEREPISVHVHNGIKIKD